MILYEDGLLKLDYDVATDILYLPCPDIYTYELVHVQKAFAVVVEVLNNYDIKKLLFDSSISRLDISAEQYNQLVMDLALGLNKTRLQKLARVSSVDAGRENWMALFLTNAASRIFLSYTIQNFKSKPVAMDWLIHK